MSVLLIVGSKCTLACVACCRRDRQTDRRADRRQTVTLRLLLDAASVITSSQYLQEDTVLDRHDLGVDLPPRDDALRQHGVGRIADDDRVTSRVFVRSQRHGRAQTTRLYTEHATATNISVSYKYHSTVYTVVYYSVSIMKLM